MLTSLSLSLSLSLSVVIQRSFMNGLHYATVNGVPCYSVSHRHCKMVDELCPGANETSQHRHRCFEFLLNILKPYLKVNWLFCLFKIRTLVADRQQTKFRSGQLRSLRNFRLAYELEETCIICKKFCENSIFLEPSLRFNILKDMNEC